MAKTTAKTRTGNRTGKSATNRTKQARARARAKKKAEPARTAVAESSFDQRDIKELWAEYKKTGSQELRDYFLLKYLPLVKYNAERVYAKLPNEVALSDLESAGVFGLLDAIDAYDLERGVKFETYCAPRIRGAILDELRSMDWVPRLVRSRTAKVEAARKRLLARLGRQPTESEIAEELGVDMEEYAKLAKDAGAVGVVSLNRKWFETDSSKDVREIDVLKDNRQVNPYKQVQRRDLRELLTRGLSRAERLILILYYYEEMTMKEIGQTLDLSESRVSQMHSSILARLKAQMSHRTSEFEDDDEH